MTLVAVPISHAHQVRIQIFTFHIVVSNACREFGCAVRSSVDRDASMRVSPRTEDPWGCQEGRSSCPAPLGMWLSFVCSDYPGRMAGSQEAHGHYLPQPRYPHPLTFSRGDFFDRLPSPFPVLLTPASATVVAVPPRPSAFLDMHPSLVEQKTLRLTYLGSSGLVHHGTRWLASAALAGENRVWL
jgi:hypothetical protein